MRINSKAIIGLEQAKTRIENINTFPNVNTEDFSLLDILQCIETETTTNVKGLMKKYRSVDENKCSLINSMPEFEITLNAEEHHLLIILTAGFLHLGSKMYQRGDKFIHDLTTNKTTPGVNNAVVVVNYRKTRSPVTVYIGKVSDHIISELAIQPAYFPRFALQARISDITRDWYNNSKHGSSVSDMSTPFVFLELDVRGAIAQYGTDTPISVMISNKIICNVAESFNLSRKQLGTFIGLMREDLRGLTITFNPCDVKDGKVVISFMMPYDNIETDVIDIRPFEFAKWGRSFSRSFGEVFEGFVEAERSLSSKRRVCQRFGMYYTYQLAVVKQLCEFKSSFME